MEPHPAATTPSTFGYDPRLGDVYLLSGTAALGEDERQALLDFIWDEGKWVGLMRCRGLHPPTRGLQFYRNKCETYPDLDICRVEGHAIGVLNLTPQDPSALRKLRAVLKRYREATGRAVELVPLALAGG